MVMHDDDGRDAPHDGIPEHFTGVDKRSVKHAERDQFQVLNLVLGIHAHDPEVFLALVHFAFSGEDGTEHFRHVRWSADFLLTCCEVHVTVSKVVKVNEAIVLLESSSDGRLWNVIVSHGLAAEFVRGDVSRFHQLAR